MTTMPRVGGDFLGFRRARRAGPRRLRPRLPGPAGRAGRPPRRPEDRPPALRRIADARPVAAHPHRADLLRPSGGRLPGHLHAVPGHDHARRHPRGSAKAAGVAGFGSVPAGPDRRRGTGADGAWGPPHAGLGVPVPSERPRTPGGPDLCRGDPLAGRAAGRRPGPRARPGHRPQGPQARQHPPDRRRPADVAGLQPFRRYQVASERIGGTHRGDVAVHGPRATGGIPGGDPAPETSGATSTASGSSSASC